MDKRISGQGLSRPFIAHASRWDRRPWPRIYRPVVVTLAGYTCAFALFALSINIILGGVGEVPLGQCLFFGIGSYGAAIGIGKLGLSFEVAVVAALVFAAVCAAIIGVITLRLTGAYFSIVSWGLTGVAMVAAANLDHITGDPRTIWLPTDQRSDPCNLAIRRPISS